MSIPDLLAELAQKGVRLSVKDENLKIQSPRGAIAPELRTELMERKAEILNFLRDAPVPSALKSVPLEEELNRQTIARLLEWDEPSSPGDRQIILNPREMAQHLTVTFRPLPEGYKNEEVLKFREDMEVTLREYGVNIQPWYRATTEIRFKIRIPLVPWKKVIRRRIVKANINALIDVEKPESWPKRLKGLATEILYQTYTWVLASGRRAPLAQKILLISWLEGRIFHRLENPFATQIITLQELDRKLLIFR